MPRRRRESVAAALAAELRGRADVSRSQAALLQALAGWVDHAGEIAAALPDEPRVLHAGADAARVYLEARQKVGLDGQAPEADPFADFLAGLSRPTPAGGDTPVA